MFGGLLLPFHHSKRCRQRACGECPAHVLVHDEIEMRTALIICAPCATESDPSRTAVGIQGHFKFGRSLRLESLHTTLTTMAITKIHARQVLELCWRVYVPI
jgi:hypothetical protein